MLVQDPAMASVKANQSLNTQPIIHINSGTTLNFSAVQIIIIETKCIDLNFIFNHQIYF